MLWMYILLLFNRVCVASPGDPWGQCPTSRQCKAKFADGSCDKECIDPECLRDGFDCLKERGQCNPGHIQYCRDHYANSHCERGCDSAPCGWDGSDCFRSQSPKWAKGTLVLQTRVPLQQGTFSNSSLLWALSILLQTSLKLRGAVPLDPNKDLFTFDPQQLADMLAQAPSYDTNGSVLFLQVDNRPCTRQAPSTCFPYATEVGNFLRAVMSLRRASLPFPPDLHSIMRVRGLREEIGGREEDEVQQETEATPTWIWAVIGVATGLVLAVALVVVLVFKKVRQRRTDRKSVV